jgi:hypothetical protein
MLDPQPLRGRRRLPLLPKCRSPASIFARHVDSSSILQATMTAYAEVAASLWTNMLVAGAGWLLHECHPQSPRSVVRRRCPPIDGKVAVPNRAALCSIFTANLSCPSAILDGSTCIGDAGCRRRLVASDSSAKPTENVLGPCLTI